MDLHYALIVPTKYDKFRGTVYRLLKKPYLAFAVACYLFIFMLVGLYLGKAPSFKSEIDLVLPGTGATTKVALDEVGQVTSQTSTPGSSGGFNPRVNYKEMLSNRGVLARAAEAMKLSPVQFGEPKVKLTEQTSIISISIMGSSPEEAQYKAWALYNSLQKELDLLRADEVAKRDASIKRVLTGYLEKVDSARGEVVAFQQGALLLSKEQLEQFISIKTRMDEKLFDTRSQLSDMTDYIQHLSINLGISARTASKALRLQSDGELTGYVNELAESSAKLSEYQSRWGENHPQVVAQTLRYESAKKAVIERSQAITGVLEGELAASLNLNNSPRRAELFAELVKSHAEQEGLNALLKTLSLSANQLEEQLRLYAKEAAELDRLEKAFDLAEAVYTSAAARLEANKADVFASYPVVQLLSEPSLAEKPSSPNKALAVVAAVFGFFFITFAVVLLCQRRAIISFVLKKS